MSQSEPWDLVAEGYAEQATWVMEPFARQALALANLTPDATLVDVAAGAGALSLLAAPAAQRVHALDFSENMLRELRKNAARAGIGNVETRVGDGQALPYDDASFDAGFSMFGLMFFPDRARGFSELWRVLKPGGQVVVSSWAPIDESPLMRLLFEAIRCVDPALYVPPANMLSLENPEVFRRELEAAGFREVAVTAHTVNVDVSNSDDFWYGMTRSSAPLCLLRKRIGEEAWQRGAALAQATLRDKLASGPTSLSTTAYLGRGRKL